MIFCMWRETFTKVQIGKLIETGQVKRTQHQVGETLPKTTVAKKKRRKKEPVRLSEEEQRKDDFTKTWAKSKGLYASTLTAKQKAARDKDYEASQSQGSYKDLSDHHHKHGDLGGGK